MSTQSVTSHAVAPHENVLIGPRQVGFHVGFHVGPLARRIIETFREWRRRIQSRHELALLSELELRDLGYPDRIEAEKAKPFWRP